MSKYDLNKLSHTEFENLVQSILKRVIGEGTKTYGSGPDWGREATFSGSAPYPSATYNWTGDWVFQAKYHDVNILGPRSARQEVVKDLKEELYKIIKRKISVNNYILATNVPLSSSHETGTHDKISNIVSEFKGKIQNIHVWGYVEICTYLDQYPEIRKAYPDLMVAEDFIDRSKSHDAKRRHQNDDIKPILECWLNASIYLERYVYLSDYSPIFLNVYVSVRNFDGCDPYNEAMQHLETGYSHIYNQVRQILCAVDRHNNRVSEYAISINERIRTEISKITPLLIECDINSSLTFQSYYLPNIRSHLGNAYPENRTRLHIEAEHRDNTDIFCLYSGPNAVALGDKSSMDSLQNFIQRFTLVVIEELTAFETNTKMVEGLVRNFTKEIKQLIPRAKYGILTGQCEFEKSIDKDNSKL